jgi:hypothetical protein
LALGFSPSPVAAADAIADAVAALRGDLIGGTSGAAV